MELIRAYSSKGSLSKQYNYLRKCIQESPKRTPLSDDAPAIRRHKRRLTKSEIADIVSRYSTGTSTNQLATDYHISKTRIAALLRARGITLRRQGLTNEQVSEAAGLYAKGRSLAWLGARYDVYHATIATALRRRGVHLRPRPGWTI